MRYPTHFSVLALDLATVAGWALLGGGVVTSGSHSFARYAGSKRRPRDHAGEPYAQFHRWLAEKLKVDKPDSIAYEEVYRWGGFAAAHCFGGYRGQMLALAACYSIPCHGYSPSDIKKHWTGKGRAEKEDMIAVCRERHPDIKIIDSNEADALAILDLHTTRILTKTAA